MLPCSGNKVDDALKSLGLLGRCPIWGSYFSLRSPRRSGHSSGLLRVAPAGEDRSAPHYTVSVSPQLSWRSFCQPCQNSSVQRSPASSSLISARNCSGAESLATLSGVSRAANMVVSCRSSISGHRSSSSNHTRGWPERLAPLVDYLAAWKLLPNVSRMGPADCRERLTY